MNTTHILLNIPKYPPIGSAPYNSCMSHLCVTVRSFRCYCNCLIGLVSCECDFSVIFLGEAHR